MNFNSNEEEIILLVLNYDHRKCKIKGRMAKDFWEKILVRKSLLKPIIDVSNMAISVMTAYC